MTEVSYLKFNGELEMGGVQVTNCCRLYSNDYSRLRDVSSVQPARHRAWLLTPVPFHMRTVPVNPRRVQSTVAPKHAARACVRRP
jgi:hypothetical protein